MTPSPARPGDAPPTTQELRELDMRVAVEVMGWTSVAATVDHPNGGRSWYVPSGFPPNEPFRKPIPEFSARIAAAFLVVEKMDSDHGAALHLTAYRHENPPPNERHSAMFWSNRDSFRSCQTRYADTAPLAICRASLSALALGDRP